jgi:hypothetical protein
MKDAYEVLDQVFGGETFTGGQATSAIATGLEVPIPVASGLFVQLTKRNCIGEAQ